MATPRRKPKERPLNARERLFCHEYVRLHGNGTQAAIAAGYSQASAAELASRLLRKIKIRALIEELNKRLLTRVDSSAESVLRELRLVAGSRLAEVFDAEGNVKPIEQWSEAEKAALSKVEVEELFAGAGRDRVEIGRLRKLAMAGKLEALGMLAKHHGLLKDEVEVSGTVEIRLVDPYAQPAAPAAVKPKHRMVPEQ